MDSGRPVSEHEVDSGVGSMNSLENSLYVSVTIPDLNIKKSVALIPDESVWAAKQQILSSVAKGLKEGFNYGLFIPSANGRAGKFMDDGRLLKEYPVAAPLGALQFIPKRRIYKHMMGSEKKMKQLHTKNSLKQLMEWIRRADAEKVIKITNQGLDPNFIDPDSGETPLTYSITLEHPMKMMVALVGGGAHLDYCNSKGLTPMHIAAMRGKEEGIKGLLDLGALTNYYDMQGLTPLYHCVCNNGSTRCLEMLLYNHATVGTTDDSLWTELHQACKLGRIQLLELLIYYGANLNAQNSGGNTPLHICAVNSQEECARVVLFRGADKTIKNFANHDAFETAIISSNVSIAKIIRDFSSDDAVPYQDMPKLNEKRRTSMPLTSSGSATLQRWRSNPQINLVGNDDRLSLKRPAFRHEYDLRLPADRSASSSSSWNLSSILDRPPTSQVSGIKQNRSNGHSGNTAADQEKAKRSANNNNNNNHRCTLPRTVFLTPGQGGYGFILRGSRGSADDSDFVPTPEVPGLQYFSVIAQSSAAEQAGIRPKDFLLEVNGKNVRTASHDYTVNLIKRAKEILCLVVASPVEAPLVKPKGSGLNHQNVVKPTASRQNSRSSGGLADLEALEKRIAASTSTESNESTSTPQRLLIAPNMQMLDRMAKTMTIGSGPGGVASIHPTHGKRMAPALSLDQPYQDVVGLCRGRISSLPGDGFQFGGISRSGSVHSLAVAETLGQSEQRMKPDRNFVSKDSTIPFQRMASVPDSSGFDGRHWPGDWDHDDNVSVHSTRTFRSPSLPVPTPLLPGSQIQIQASSKENSSARMTALKSSRVDELSEMSIHGTDLSRPPPLPPLRPGSLPKSSSFGQLMLSSASTAQGINSVPPLPSPSSPSSSILSSMGSAPTSNKVTFHHGNLLKDDLVHHDETFSSHPFLRSPQPSQPASSEYAMIPGDGFGEEPERSTVTSSFTPSSSTHSSSAPSNSFLSELQLKKTQIENRRAAAEDFYPNAGEKEPKTFDSSSSAPSNSLLSELQLKKTQMVSRRAAAEDFYPNLGEKEPETSNASSSTPSNSFLSELQLRKTQVENRRVAADDVYPNAGEKEPETPQQPILNELLKALSSRLKANTAPNKIDTPNVTINNTGKIPTLPKKFANEKPKIDLPAAQVSPKTEDEIPVLMVKLQPVSNRTVSRSVIPPAVPPPPSQPPKFNHSVPFKGSGSSIGDIDLDFPLPPPPPLLDFGDDSSQDFSGDDFVPLPPPPMMDF